MRIFIAIVFGLVGGAGSVGAQPAAPPATAPTRYVMVVPPGFESVTVAGHTAICMPNDLEWVRKGMADVKPATRPTTMPSDVFKLVTDHRAEVIRQMVGDLALADDKEVSGLFNEKILPTLKKMDEMKPPVFFLVLTRDQLRELCKTGWGEPRFHYNRTANEVSYQDSVMLSLDKAMDDSVLPFFYEVKDPAETRAKNFAIGIQILDGELAKLISQQTQPLIYNLLAQHIGEKCFDLLKLPRDQQWLALGVTGYFSAKYAGELTPTGKDTWLEGMIFEDARFPVSSKAIDLAHPAEVASMRPVAVPYYDQAIRRKAVRVVKAWAEKNGEASIIKAIAAIRAKAPADGAGLVKTIAEASGVDLTKELEAQ